jgi:diguanylate cyclase (GGDEF)-like protein
MEPTTGIFAESAFLHLLTREASRATRYQDFFSVCLLKPDVDCSQGAAEVERTVTRKIAQFLRSTDMIGRVDDRIAVLLLHTEGADAVRVAERLRSHIEQVAFPGAGPNASGHVTLSVGGVSFRATGQWRSPLAAQAHLSEAPAAGQPGGSRQRTQGGGTPMRILVLDESLARRLCSRCWRREAPKPRSCALLRPSGRAEPGAGGLPHREPRRPATAWETSRQLRHPAPGPTLVLFDEASANGPTTWRASCARRRARPERDNGRSQAWTAGGAAPPAVPDLPATASPRHRR